MDIILSRKKNLVDYLYLFSVISVFVYLIIYVLFQYYIINFFYETNYISVSKGVYQLVWLLIVIFQFIVLLFLLKETINSRVLFVLLFGIFIPLFSTLLNEGIYGIINLEYPDIYMWFMPFVNTSLYFRKRQVNIKSFTNIVFVFCILYGLMCIPLIYYNAIGLGLDGGIIGPTYFLMALLPLVLLFCTGYKRIIGSFVIALVIMFSLKRTGIAATIAAFLSYFLFKGYLSKRASKRLKLFISVLSVLLVGLIGVYLSEEYLGIAVFSRFNTIIEDGGSGRADIYKYIFNVFSNSDVLEKVLGHGFHAVSNLNLPGNEGRGILAHSDFFEILYDYGYIGIFAYLLLFLSLIKNFFILLKKRSIFLPSYSAGLVLFMFVSLFSYGISQRSCCCVILFLFFALVFSFEKKGGNYELSN